MATLNILVAKTTGSPTIFVLDNIQDENKLHVAKRLLSVEKFQSEQIAFIPNQAADGYDGVLEMAGSEFCGSAILAYGLYLARKNALRGDVSMKIAVRNGNQTLSPLTVEVNTQTGNARFTLPPPRSIETIQCPLLPLLDGKKIIDFGDVHHIILNDIPADERTFERVKDFMIDNYPLTSLGVMFYDTKFKTFVPGVYVKETDTSFFKSSCATGAAAVSVHLCRNKKEDGSYHFNLMQPGGVLYSTVIKKGGQLQEISIEGSVKLFEPGQAEID